jgi:hypothetical protein
MHSYTSLFDNQFHNPDTKYRVKPFWFWNGDMTETEIAYQLDEMKDKGIGGVFISARQGLTIPYLSQRWFDLVRFAIEKAESLGLEIWLSDEYPYPSGMAGGEVLLRHPEAVHCTLRYDSFIAEPGTTVTKQIDWTEIESAQAVPQTASGEWIYDKVMDLKPYIGILQVQELYQETGLTAYNQKRFFSYNPRHILTINMPSQITAMPVARWKIEICGSMAVKDFKYYGGFFDPCNTDAVDTFIAVTHEQYRNRLGNDFKYIKGFFSDETGLLGAVPWSKKLLKAYEKRYLKPLGDDILSLFDVERPDSIKIRYQYYECLHELLRENYHKKIADWCRNQNVYYVTEVPSMRMSTQYFSDVIGGDCCHEKLGKSLEEIYDRYLCNFRANSKSIASLARQLNKPYAMVESFHSVGWTMTLQDAKAMIDYMGIHGINFFVFHAFYYTIDGITKYDAPPSQFLQNPYWKYYKKLADYAARISVLNKETQSAVSIAVLDSAPSLWITGGNPFQGFAPKGLSETEQRCCTSLKKSWQNICKCILFNQLDYDHLDGEILQQAAVKDVCLCIGQASYRVLVLTPAICMEESGARKILEFLQQGGHVVAVGSQDYRDIGQGMTKLLEAQIQKSTNYTAVAMEDDQLKTPPEFIDLLQTYAPGPLRIAFKTGNQKELMVSIRYREPDEKAGTCAGTDSVVMLFVVNHGDTPVSFAIESQENQKIESIKRLDLENGENESVKICRTWNLAAYESILFEIVLKNADKEPVKAECVPMDAEVSNTLAVDISRKGIYQREGLNVYRMAEFELSLDEQNWKTVETKTFIEQIAAVNLLTQKNIIFRGDFGIPKKMEIQYPLPVYYRQVVKITGMDSRYYLMYGRRTFCGTAELLINDQLVDIEAGGKTRLNDFNNRIQEITGYLHNGDNSIDIRMNVCSDSDGLCDPLYILGNFYVDEQRNSIISQPYMSAMNQSYVSGSPFYSGTVCWKFEEDIENAGRYTEITLSGYSGHDCVEVWINDVLQDIRCFTPYKFKLQPSVLVNGINQIEVKITNTLANMLEGTFFDYRVHKTYKIGKLQ